MIILGFLIILALVALNGFFVAAEFSLVSVRITRIDELIKENKPLALLTRKAIEKVNDMLSVCQVGITIASLLLGWLGEALFAEGLGHLFTKVGFLVQYANALNIHAISVSLSFIFITILHVVLGELVPKSMALQNAEYIALKSSVPIFGFYYLFYPITYFMNRVTNFVLRIMNLPLPQHSSHSLEELKMLVEEHQKNNNTLNSENSELSILQKTFEFSNQEAQDVMTHRTGMVCVPNDMKIKDMVAIIAEHNFSRYPVYEKTIDKIIGIVHVHSIFQWMNQTDRDRNATVTAVMQTPIFIPESKPVDDILQKMRAAKQHMAIVVDEYGGVAGIITLEDIIEEVFGSIQDETDEQDRSSVYHIRSNSFVIDGEAELDELKEILAGEDIELFNDVRTIAGFFLEKHQDIPKEGSCITISSGTLTVEKMEGNKIVDIRYDLAPLSVFPTQEEYD